jgi:small subunit ribosomal protein S19
MPRSLKKGPFCNPKLIDKVKAAKAAGSSKSVRTWYRSSTVLPEFIGVWFEVHNGKNFIKFLVSEDMVGYKLGEFAPTTKFINHGGKLAKVQKK